MPRDSQGGASLPPGTLVNSGDTILPSQHNPAMQDIASMLTGSLSRDGLGGMRAPLAMGGFKATNMADPTNDQDAATKAYVDDSAVDAFSKTESDARYSKLANNLSDLPDKTTARTNLGLGSASTQSGSAFAPAAGGFGANPQYQTYSTAQRPSAGTFTNTSGHMMWVSMSGATVNFANYFIVVSGVEIGRAVTYATANFNYQLTAMVPPGGTYQYHYGSDPSIIAEMS